MNVRCNVIRDILPLYAEDLVSDDTKDLVKDHLCDCDGCRSELDRICKAANVPVDADARTMKKVRKEIQKRRWWVAAQTLLIVLAVLTTIFNCLLMPVNIPTDEAFEKIFTDDLGRLFVKFREGTYRFEIRNTIMEGESKETRHIYAYTNGVDWYYRHLKPEDPGGYEFKIGTGEVDKIERVLFGTDNRLVWGNPLKKDVYIGTTLPQMILAAAVVTAMILTVLYKLVAQKKHAKGLLYSALMFWSYVAANLVSIKFDLNTYYMLFDEEAIFSLILFAIQALLIYGSVMLTITRPKNKAF